MTLVETLIALVILSICLGAALEIFSGGLRTAHTIEAYVQAVSLAELFLARVGVEEPLIPGTQAGRFDEKLSWQLDVRSHMTAQGTETQSPAPSLYDVTLTVSWKERLSTRSFSLETMRLAPTS